VDVEPTATLFHTHYNAIVDTCWRVVCFEIWWLFNAVVFLSHHHFGVVEDSGGTMVLQITRARSYIGWQRGLT
jgi:hypothetical protein